ncbi:MAG: PAQR family membrane homeostasis protein TrhA [Bacillota bacterium]
MELARERNGLGWSIKDPVSALTHMSGAVLAAVGLILLLRAAAGNPWRLVSFAVFGVSLILLYTASTVYHWLRLPTPATAALRRVDHTMIFVLIAGTYTPFCLGPLRGPWGWSLFGAVWGLAAAGLLMKLFWLQAPRWVSTLVYLAMGWIVAVATAPLLRTVPAGGLSWLLAGGLFYTVGAVMYAFKWPGRNARIFGFHELFHLFVMAGSLSHFWAVYRYLSRLG